MKKNKIKNIVKNNRAMTAHILNNIQNDTFLSSFISLKLLMSVSRPPLLDNITAKTIIDIINNTIMDTDVTTEQIIPRQ